MSESHQPEAKHRLHAGHARRAGLAPRTVQESDPMAEAEVLDSQESDSSEAPHEMQRRVRVDRADDDENATGNANSGYEPLRGVERTGSETERATETEEVVLGDDDLDPQDRISLTETLIEQHHATVFRYAYWLTGCSASAEDICQDVFTRAFRGLHTLRDASKAKSWLMTITRNEFARWCKKTKTNRTEESAVYSDMSEQHRRANEETPERLADCEWVAAGLASLANEFRAVVLMYYFEKLSYAEIASELGIPIGTVMSRMNRGKSHLKLALEKLGNPRASMGSQERHRG